MGKFLPYCGTDRALTGATKATATEPNTANQHRTTAVWENRHFTYWAVGGVCPLSVSWEANKPFARNHSSVAEHALSLCLSEVTATDK
jgi:hypothetical protein